MSPLKRAENALAVSAAWTDLMRALNAVRRRSDDGEELTFVLEATDYVQARVGFYPRVFHRLRKNSLPVAGDPAKNPIHGGSHHG